MKIEDWINIYANEEFRRETDLARESGMSYFRKKYIELFNATDVLKTLDEKENVRQMQDVFTKFGPLGVFLALFQATRNISDDYEGDFDDDGRTGVQNRIVIKEPLGKKELLRLANQRDGFYMPEISGSASAIVELAPGDGAKYQARFRVEGNGLTVQPNKAYEFPFRSDVTVAPERGLRRVDIEFSPILNSLIATDEIRFDVPLRLEGYREGQFVVPLNEVRLVGKNSEGQRYEPDPSYYFETLAANFLPKLMQQ